MNTGEWLFGLMGIFIVGLLILLGGALVGEYELAKIESIPQKCFPFIENLNVKVNDLPIINVIKQHEIQNNFTGM